MASPNSNRDNDKRRELEKKQQDFLERKIAVFERTREADEELKKITQEQMVVQEQLQELNERERLKQTLEALKVENANQLIELQAKEAELNCLKKQFAVYRQEHGRAGDLDKMKSELETLRHQITEQGNTLRRTKEALQRTTRYSNTQRKQKEDALRRVASLEDEILALRQISEETQQRQLSEIQSTAAKRQQQQLDADHADVLHVKYGKVCSTVDAQSVARNMFQCNALTLKELQSIQSKHCKPVKAAEQLLNIVMNQSGNVYSCFLDALKKTGHQHVYEVIVSGSYKDFDERFEHTQIIRQHYLFLVDTVIAKHSGLIGELYQAEVFSREEIESVNSEGMSFRQNEKLLSMLSRKTKEEFDKFLNALDKTGQHHVHNHITGRKRSAQKVTETPETTSLGESAARVVKNISTDTDTVVGVTTIDDELFVLLWRDDNQVAVYSINDYQLLRHLTVPGYKPLLVNDMTSCVKHKCLYMSDTGNKCIFRYGLSGGRMKRLVGSHVSKWSVAGYPSGLSVTPDCNLLVTCYEPNILVELSDSGLSVRETALNAEIEFPWHAVQLTFCHFVVCHGSGSDTLHRVSVVDDDGKVARSYGGRRGSDVGQLNEPRHLAVDKDSQFVFIADHDNKRVALLSPTLQLVRYVIEGLSGPKRLYFHQLTRRLFVGQYPADVTVIQF